MIPKSCSITTNGLSCNLAASHIISVKTNWEEYMIGTLCDDHFFNFEKQVKQMQETGRIPKWDITFQKLRLVFTECFLNFESVPRNASEDAD